MKIYEKILYCRKKAGMSQEALADKLGVSRQAISKWECGTAAPELDNLLAISKLFGVTTDWLLNDEEEIPDEEEKVSDQQSDEMKNGAQRTSERRSSNPEWIENLPHLLVKAVKRFGWLVGVYISCVGAGIAGLGGIMKFIVNRMFAGVTSEFGSYGTPQVEIVGEIPAGLEDEILAEIYGSSGGVASDIWDTGADQFAAFAEHNPVSIFAGIMIFVGIVMIIGGIVLALWLRHLSKKNS